MSLLREIQNDLARPDADVVTVLRKCKILAARLNSVELTHWVDSELNGYGEAEPIPEYRLLRAQCYGDFMNIRWRAEHQPIHPIAVPEEHRETFFAPIQFREGITTAMAFASADGATIDEPLIAIMVKRHQVMYPQMECMSAWKKISATQFQQLIDAVKNRVLDFSLKIEAENPSAGEASPNSQPVAKEKLQPLVQNTFYGPVGNVAQNSDHFSQSSGTLRADDLSRLVRELTQHIDELGLNDREKQRADAQIAILRTELAGEPDPAIITQAGRTLRNITEGAIGSLIATAAQPPVWAWIHQTLTAFGAK
jgi:hypothetical protein